VVLFYALNVAVKKMKLFFLKKINIYYTYFKMKTFNQY